MDLFKYLATSVAPTLSTILITVAYLPQIIKTAKKKSVEDLSVGFWILITAFLICMVTNATYLLLTADGLGYFVTEVINLTFAVVILIQIAIYRKK
ncbi:PQ-loop repeat-containing protein [Bacillus wiedmannii]|uniref:PQ-loop repeat-containing protein n=1 Tax=Bacillus wiedmannii TaxID=1890302 RepID=UPI000BF14AD1|nr:PQ-loop repeat-containing protein [Bacillus wiedmannii]PEN61647.1 hypothetical protein CN576_21695 [Bacillus wiedmannii]PHA62891.1 hypothetical protein COE75_16795 [Bacillus wiedmannii]